MATGHEDNNARRQLQIVVAGGIQTDTVEAFDRETRTWLPLPPMNQVRAHASSVVYQNCMFVIGRPGIPISIEMLNLAQPNEGWKKHPLPLPESPFQDLHGHVCLVYKKQLLVIGGQSNNNDVDTIYEIQLTPPFGSELLSNMPQRIRHHGAVVMNGKIFIIGGTTGPATRNNVLEFDPQANPETVNPYRELNPLQYAVSQMATTVCDDNVFILGGKDNEGNALNTAIMYNVTTEVPTRLPDMTTKRYGCTAVTIGKNIIVMGGVDETGAHLNSAECCEFERGTPWAAFPAMIMPRACATAARCNIPLP